MATFEHIMLVGGPLDGEIMQGAFGDRLYFDMALKQIQSPLSMDHEVQNTRLRYHSYRRSLPTYEFDYEGEY